MRLCAEGRTESVGKVSGVCERGRRPPCEARLRQRLPGKADSRPRCRGIANTRTRTLSQDLL